MKTLTYTFIAFWFLLIVGSVYGVAHREKSKPQMCQPVFIWNDDLEGLPADGSPIMLERTSNDTIYLGVIPEKHDK